MTIKYIFKANWLWYVFSIMLVIITYYATLHYNFKQVQALDLEIEKMHTKAVIDYCYKTKGKQLIIRSSGGESINVCNQRVWRKK